MTACRICGAEFIPSHPEMQTCSEGCLERDIANRLARLRQLRLDCVLDHGDEWLIRRYAEVVVPKVEEFVRLVRLSDNEHRLLDLQDHGYLLTLDDEGNVTDVKLRGWGVSGRDYGP